MFAREYVIVSDCNWMNIQKNASSYIKDVLQKSYGDGYQIWGNPDRGLPTWCVVREPYDRYIAGLSYDIYYNQYSNWDNIFLNLLDTVQGSIGGTFRINGRVKHTLLQSNYFMFQPIDFFVKIEDVKEFCYINWQQESDDYNKVPTDFKKDVIKEIKSRKLEPQIRAMLANDNEIYNSILSSEKIWSWQNGSIVKG